MKSDTCPYCRHNPAVPFWRKSSLGPAVTTKCRTCHKKVNVSWWSILVFVPLLPILIYSRLELSFAQGAGIWIAVLAINCYFHWKSIPLVRK